ncbi:triose-phosphate isomerase [Jannaschia aquimarina]|uniref:Triosephosphate isomerase n=1 Tax=Jannaschia aquimarina TaxID=935700 RepID=A0A0D1EHZ5_9RHOB|nr:triose-phosphate isomerase [Jannaschia aquimarina]KIT17254.1 Triosephosphate isomerase [Jannaschia aquimarina]SNT19151.1 triosephosphate isomerase [Jannaschia aquimarina]
MPTKIAAGNWKMNGTRAALEEAHAIAQVQSGDAQVVICPPATLLTSMPEGLATGGQYCHPATSGAHTGDLSAEMLADAGASYCITGHSERRTDHKETDADVRAQTEAAWRAGLIAILCIGETLDQREAGETLAVLSEQLRGSLPDGATAETLIVAYEPVWAIGTGKVATPDQVAEVHDALRDQLGAEISLLYGGSVKAGNAAELFALDNVDGALVGGASLKAKDFIPIVEALAAS